MTENADWMKPMDDRILDLLARTQDAKIGGMWLRPVTIAHNLDATRQYISKRLGRLVDNGLVERDKDGYYRITNAGLSYVKER